MTEKPAPWEIDLHRLIGREEIRFDWAALQRAVSGRTIAITGAGGSIGSALAERTARLGARSLLLIEHHEDSLFDLRRTLQEHGLQLPARFALVDVRDREALLTELVRHPPDVLFHLAAYKHVPIGEENPAVVVRVNIGGTLAVLDVAGAIGTPTLVYPSTDKAVNPPSVYGATKRAVELMLREHATFAMAPSPRVVRLVNTVGAQGGVIRTFVEQAAAARPLTVTDPNMTRYWISMSEALGLLLTASASSLVGPLILAVGAPVKLVDVARKTWDVVRADGSDPRIRVIGARHAERLHEYLVRDDERLVPSERAGVFVAESIDVGSPSGIMAKARRLLADLPPDECALRQALFELIGEPLKTPEPSAVSTADA